MNRIQLVENIAKKTKMTNSQCDKMLAALCDIVKSELKKGESVTIVGFGKWEVRKRAKRNSYNPHTKKVVITPASTVPAFKAGKALKMAVNNKK